MRTINKKTYNKPTVTAHSIDHEISLVMMTYTNPDGPPFPLDSEAASPAEDSPQPNSFDENPFGE